ncbi:MAG TPA: transketolase, partial [Bacteroidales bacterium]|nr:transketolase [Bacteroidales bacterium]
MNSKELMNKAADNIRILVASMVEKAKSGHPGGAMGGADFINVLYSEFLEYDPRNMKFFGRDRFFLDPGHMAPMLYAQLAIIGKYSMEELATLRQWDSPVTGHPELDVARGVENTSGPLGQGHVYAVGAAIAAKRLAAILGEEIMDHKIYTYISDGGIQEEISQGAGRIAGTLGLDNLIMFYDSNDIQLSTETSVVTSEDTAAKYRAWDWNVYEIDGNDVDQIRAALSMAQIANGKPTLIIGKCIMGKGALKADCTSYERSCKTHGAPLGGDAYVNTVKALGGDPENPFQIFPEVQKLYSARARQLRKIMDAKYARNAAWEAANPEKAALLKEWFSGKAPRVDWSKVEQKADDSTRSASAAVLSQLAQQVPNMICASADLSNSDKTDGF